MAVAGFNTGGSGGGGVTDPSKILSGGSAWSSIGSNIGSSLTAAKAGAASRKLTSTSGESSGNWYCPEGSTLVRESTGSGNLVCRWNHNGAEFQALSRAGGGGSSGGGSTSGVGGNTGTGVGSTGQRLANAVGNTVAPSGTSVGSSEYLQAAADIYARNPETMLADLLERKHGEYNGNALYAQLEPYADAANVLFLLQNGQDAESGSKDEFIKYLGNYWDTLQTPGGRINYQGMMNNLLNPAEGSPLHSYLTTGNSEDQAGNFLRLMAGVAQTGYHPLIAQAVMDRLGLEADRYIGASGRMAADPFYTRLDARIPGLPKLLPYT